MDNGAPLFFIAGPCALESRAQALEVSGALKEIFTAVGIPFIYKSSFDKANRSSGASFRGVGMTRALHSGGSTGKRECARADRRAYA